MDYQKIYNALIEHARNNPYNGYTETHHVTPRCMGGTNDRTNLVRLSAKQHFVAHHLLYKIHRTTQLAHAWFSMCRVGIGQEERLVNARYFDKVKSIRSALLSEQSKGELNHFYGKRHSEESRKKMREAHQRARYWERRTPEHAANLLAAQKRPKTEEHKAKIGRKGMVTLQNIHTRETRRVYKTDEVFGHPDWVHIKLLNPEKKFKCDYCDMVTTRSNLKRWHNEQCKKKPVEVPDMYVH